MILENLFKTNIIFVLIAASMAILSLALKSLRWQIFLRDVKIKIPFSLAFSTFTSGLLISLFTPGRIAEPIRGYILKKKTNASFSSTLPLIVVERIIDLIVILIFSVLCLFIISSISPKIAFFLNLSAVFTVLVLIITIAALINEKFGRIFLKNLIKLPFIKKFQNKIEYVFNNFYTSSKKIKPQTIVIITLITFFVWILEGLILYLAAYSLNIQLSFITCIAIMALAQLIGLLSSLPGGLGSIEAVMTLLLIPYVVSASLGSSITLIYRVSSLWVAVFVGILVLIKTFGLRILKSSIK